MVMAFNRIWGSFGQKMLSETSLFVIKEECSFINRSIELLKLSGLPNPITIQSALEIEQFTDKATPVVLIVDYNNYLDDIENIRKLTCPVIVYNGTSFKSIFPKLLCTYSEGGWGYYIYLNNIF